MALLTIEDYRVRAESMLPRLARDYYNGAAEDEITLKRNQRAFDNFLIRPRCLRDVTTVSTATSWLGASQPFPIGIAPTAFHKMATHEGEIATARGAARSGSLMIASSWSTVPLEAIASESKKHGGQHWFQLYVYKDRAITAGLITRAEAAGYTALVLTVDTPVLGRRLADVRNGFTLPEPLSLANFADPSAREMDTGSSVQSGFMAYVKEQIDSSLNWETLEWIKSRTCLPILVKGIMRGDDAREAVSHGVDGIIVSNHGGRQMDCTPATIEVLPEVLEAVHGNCQVFIDGGIRNGRDIFKAIALGAAGVFVGRPVLWGLTVQSDAGVENIIKILQSEFLHALQLSGCRSIQELQSCNHMVVHQNYYSKM